VASETVRKVDVLVVGLGPVGAALANLLGRFGVRTLIVDQATEIFLKPRAIALNNEALRILQMVGLDETAFPRVAIPEVLYHSPIFGRFGRVNTARIIDCHPMLVTFFQPQLETALRDRIKQFPSLEVRLGVALESIEDDGSRVLARLKGGDGSTLTVSARYLVGADGSNSLVRRLLGLEFHGRSFQQDWLIVDARNVPNPIDHCEFRCDPNRPTPHMVAPGGRQRWEFMLKPGESAEEMEKPESVRRLLAAWCRMEDIEIERTAVYRFHAREATSFSKGRCFLVGDAAHITPPFAGQGLVAGLRDVANLAWKLAAVLKGFAAEPLLESYDKERRPHARKTINLALFLGALVMPSNRFVAFVLHGLMGAIRLLPAGRALLEDLKIKPANTFEEGFFSRNTRNERLRAGSTIPQGWVRHGRIAEPILSDDALGLDWALISFGPDPSKLVCADLLARWRSAGGRVFQWCQRSQALHLSAEAERVEVLDESLLPGKVPLSWVAIVRPDRCVLAEGPSSQTEQLLEEALRRLGGERVSGRGLASLDGAKAMRAA
jgi:3-(3-hydroxy-phenyl)propionate hydroxylase